MTICFSSPAARRNSRRVHSGHHRTSIINVTPMVSVCFHRSADRASCWTALKSYSEIGVVYADRTGIWSCGNQSKGSMSHCCNRTASLALDSAEPDIRQYYSIALNNTSNTTDMFFTSDQSTALTMSVCMGSMHRGIELSTRIAHLLELWPTLYRP